MVLIAIDKQSRKILGYLCKNNQNYVAYCCSDCDVEYKTAQELEKHMVIHEIALSNEDLPFEVNDSNINDVDEADIPLNILSNVEKEKKLKRKYQVTPCSVQLYRFDNDDIQSDLNESATTVERNTNQENVIPANEPFEKRTPGPASRTVKRQKSIKKEMKKGLKKQSSSPPVCCYLCGQKFQSTVTMEEHLKTHMQSSNDYPVFPCKVCGKNVKNLKLHLLQHKKENEKSNGKPRKKSIDMKRLLEKMTLVQEKTISNVTKVEEASSSTDAVFSRLLLDKECDNDMTSNEALTEQQNIHLLNKNLDKNEPPIISPSSDMISQSKLPPIVIEEYTVNGAIKSFSENEPSQSAERSVIENGIPQQNDFINETYDSIIKENIAAKPDVAEDSSPKKKKEIKKVPCTLCSKRVALSYKRVHIKKYHTNVVNNIPPAVEQ